MEELEKIPDYADVFTVQEFIQAVRDGMFTPDDGIGYFATVDAMSKTAFSFSDFRNRPKWVTHIAWFNK